LSSAKVFERACHSGGNIQDGRQVGVARSGSILLSIFDTHDRPVETPDACNSRQTVFAHGLSAFANQWSTVVMDH
jgi:hypothetical protein